MASIKGIIVEIGGDTSGLQKALSKVNSSTSSLSRELKGVNSLLKLDPKNTELVAQKQQILKENIEETSKKIEKLKKAQEMADRTIAEGGEISQENYRNLQREIINTENKLKELKTEASNWTKAGRSIEEFGNKITNISNKIDKMGTTLTTSLTLPIAGIATAAVTVGNSFEAQMSRVQAIAGATKEELKLLTEQAVQLGAETSFGATEVAQGMENLASAGFTTKEIMEAMPGMLDLAASSGADLATSSEIAASAIRGFGLEASTATHIADVYAEAAARTNAQTEDMGEAMKYIAPVANTMGISLEETAAAIGIMSDAGIKGSQAGTSLRGALTRLTKPTDKMLGIMEDLGVEFYDSNGKMKSLTEMVDMLSKNTKGLTDEQKQNALTILFGTESLSGMLSLINRGSDELDSMTKAFKDCNGSASKMADTMLDNTSGAIEEMKGAFESAGIAIQQALAPEIKDLAKKVQSLVDDFNKLTDEEKENIVKTVAFVAAIGPAIKIVGTFGKTLGNGIKTVGSFSQAISLMGKTSTEAFKNASAGTQTLAKALTFLTSPAGLATTGITLLTVSLVAVEKSISKNVEKVKELKENIEENIQARKELKAEQDKQITNNLAEINNTQSLYEELKTITDENGNIKKGYEKRANFIVGQLNSALGTEIGINGNVIESYKQIQEEIDKTILKKKAEIYLQTQEENYKKALESRADTYEKLSELQDELTEAQNRLNEAQEKMNNSGGISKVIATDEYRAAQAEIKNLNQAISEQNELISDYSEDVNLYNDNIQLMAEGTTESLNKVIENSTKKMTEQKVTLKGTVYEQISTLQDSINKQKSLHTIALNNQDETNEKAYQNQIEADEKQLIELGKQLAQMTSSIETLSPEQIEAWRKLSQSSQTAFNESIKYLPTDVQNKLKEVLNITENSTIPDNFGTLANISESSFDTNLSNISEDTDNLLTTVSNKMKNDTSLKEGTENLAKEAEKGFNDNVDGSKWGSDLTEEISTSMTTKESKNSIVSAASKVAGWIADFLHFTLPDKGPLSDMDESMPDMIEIMTRGIDENKSKLVSSASKMARDLDNALTNRINIPQIEDYGKIQGNLSSQIVDSTKTIFTTPQIVFNVQELDEGKLQQCFDYVNRKFGSKY